MRKTIHEIRDPIHVFIKIDDDERSILDSRAFQRLRHIHQLAMTYLVYPGATHRRFEHSLGVMELAGRVFDVITHPEHVTDTIRNTLRPLRGANSDELAYWRRVVRLAALCHDMGHLPFSHAAEKELLPDEWSHEQLTRTILEDTEIETILKRTRPTIRQEDIVKLAIGRKEAKDLEFTDWEEILSEIIVGDAFGVDRMDYLLRDSHHTGVAYGRFDHFRLIDTLRILQYPTSEGSDAMSAPALGVEHGGIYSAEALMLARYFMYTQVYFHPVRRIYDIHLKDFLKAWLADGFFSTEIERHLQMTDNEVSAAFWNVASNANHAGHEHARRIVRRHHFKRIYERNPDDVRINPEAGKAVFKGLCNQFGMTYFRHDRYQQTGGAPDFPVRMHDDKVVSSLDISDVLGQVPVVSVDYVYAMPEIVEDAKKWLDAQKDRLIAPSREEDTHG